MFQLKKKGKERRKKKNLPVWSTLSVSIKVFMKSLTSIDMGCQCDIIWLTTKHLFQSHSAMNSKLNLMYKTVGH